MGAGHLVLDAYFCPYNSVRHQDPGVVSAQAIEHGFVAEVKFARSSQEMATSPPNTEASKNFEALCVPE